MTCLPSSLILYDLIISNKFCELKRFVDANKMEINRTLNHVRKRHHSGMSPIHLVVSKGNFDMLRYLIHNGVNVQQTTTTSNRRAVHYAALMRQASCMQLLINAGANLEVYDIFGNTPLHYAAEDGDSGILSLLLNNGTNVDVRDITHKTPLIKASRNGKICAVRKLITFGAQVNLKDKQDETALHYACRRGSPEIACSLIKAGGNMNVQNASGMTPLMEAVAYNQAKTVIVLSRQRNLDLYKREYSHGDTALHIAVKKNYTHIVEVLLGACNWYIEFNFNKFGESFVHDVMSQNRLDLLNLLLKFNYNFDKPARRRRKTSMMIDDHAENQLQQIDEGDRVGIVDESPFWIALERGHFEICRILSETFCYTLSPKKELPISNEFSRRYQTMFEVKSLKKWCRKTLREHLGFSLRKSLPHLGLPDYIKDFILLDDLRWPKYDSYAGGRLRTSHNSSELRLNAMDYLKIIKENLIFCQKPIRSN